MSQSVFFLLYPSNSSLSNTFSVLTIDALYFLSIYSTISCCEVSGKAMVFKNLFRSNVHADNDGDIVCGPIRLENSGVLNLSYGLINRD